MLGMLGIPPQILKLFKYLGDYHTNQQFMELLLGEPQIQTIDRRVI